MDFWKSQRKSTMPDGGMNSPIGQYARIAQ